MKKPTRFAGGGCAAAVAVAGTLLLLASCSSEPPAALSAVADEAPAHVGAVVCAQCHEAEYAAWRDSHHDLAMQEATPATVLADFDATHFEYAGIRSSFSRRDDKFFVRTDGPDGKLTEYEIAYTYGVEPLQQYLIRFPAGRLQALSICWDTRPAADGGQRWFHLYPDAAIDYRDPLHWTGPQYNWNFMCAECHSTRVRKNYAARDDTFKTTWAEIDVACEACHGPGSKHVAWAGQAGDGPPQAHEGTGIVSLKDGGRAAWRMDAATGIAQRSEARTQRSELATCGRCHARRAILSEDYRHGGPLLNTHSLALLDEGLYHADGQILDEVYVYGSFLQSAMHGAGVTCTDCHDSHSLELRAPGNGVCAQCHEPARFDVQSHHRHEVGTAAAQCVGCHMSSRDYMVIDGRRDHSFRVPRPDLTAARGTPNACNDCHQDQTPQWAAAHVVQWHGEGRRQTPHYGEILSAGRRGAASAGAALANLTADTAQPAIVRATALSLLREYPGQGAAAAIARGARSEEPLLRLAAADAAGALDGSARLQHVGPLLSDPILAVRLAAAASLMAVPRGSLSEPLARSLSSALEEYRGVQRLNADRAESRINLGALLSLEGDARGALAEFGKAVEIAPAFAAAYVNMADLYRDGDQELNAETVLRRGLDAVPGSADLHHALGLSLVRQRRYGEAMGHLRLAAEQAPNNARYAYVLGVALHSTGAADRALEVLDAAHERRPANREILFALATIARDSGDRTRAAGYAEKVLALDPDDAGARQLLQQLAPSGD